MTDSLDTEYAILGAGIAGCAVANYLAQLGVRRGVVLDSHTIGGGATAKAAAMVMAQTLNPVLTRMSAYSMHEYEHFDDQSAGAVAIRRTGSALYTLTRIATPKLRAAVDTQMECGVESRLLDAKEFARMYPHIRCDDLESIAYCASDGYIDQWSLLRYYVNNARAAGFIFREHQSIRNVSFDGGRFRLESSTGTVRADRLILAAGRNAPRFANMFGIDLDLSWNRRQIVVFEHAGKLEPFPIMECIDDDWYFRPHGEHRILVGEGPTDSAESPDQDGMVTDEIKRVAVAAARAHVAARLPVVAEALVPAHWSGVRGLTRDEMPIIDEARTQPGLFFCCGLSAFGITLSPVAGLLTASLATGSRVPGELSPVLAELTLERCIRP